MGMAPTCGLPASTARCEYPTGQAPACVSPCARARTPHGGSTAAPAPNRHRGGPPLARPSEERARGAKFVRSASPRRAAPRSAPRTPPPPKRPREMRAASARRPERARRRRCRPRASASEFPRQWAQRRLQKRQATGRETMNINADPEPIIITRLSMNPHPPSRPPRIHPKRVESRRKRGRSRIFLPCAPPPSSLGQGRSRRKNPSPSEFEISLPKQTKQISHLSISFIANNTFVTEYFSYSFVRKCHYIASH